MLAYDAGMTRMFCNDLYSTIQTQLETQPRETEEPIFPSSDFRPVQPQPLKDRITVTPPNCQTGCHLIRCFLLRHFAGMVEEGTRTLLDMIEESRSAPPTAIIKRFVKKIPNLKNKHQCPFREIIILRTIKNVIEKSEIKRDPRVSDFLEHLNLIFKAYDTLNRESSDSDELRAIEDELLKKNIYFAFLKSLPIKPSVKRKIERFCREERSPTPTEENIDKNFICPEDSPAQRMIEEILENPHLMNNPEALAQEADKYKDILEEEYIREVIADC